LRTQTKKTTISPTFKRMTEDSHRFSREEETRT
jgi:hypothetical protein